MPYFNAFGEDLDAEHDLTEVEINQAIFDFQKFGVFEQRAWYGLMRRDLITSYRKWIKPIPWAIEINQVTPFGWERALALEVEDLGKPNAKHLLKRDLFQASEIGRLYTGHLSFSAERIKNIIDAGHYRELARVMPGDVFYHRTDKQKSEAHPDIFPPEVTDV